MTAQEKRVDPASLRTLAYDKDFYSILADVIEVAVVEGRELCAGDLQGLAGGDPFCRAAATSITGEGPR